MGSRPHKGQRGNDPVAQAADSNVIQYPQGHASRAVEEKKRIGAMRRLGDDPEREMSETERDIEEWRVIHAVLQGDVIEFSILVNRYQKPIFHLMLRLTGRTVAAEDLTQDAFTRAYEKLNSFKKGKRFFSWLYAIAANIGRDYLRRKGLQNDLFSDKPFDGGMPDPNRDDCARKPDCVAQVNEIGDALNQLPSRYSETMLLYYREGLTAKEIAAALDISTAAVKLRVYRGRKMLQQKIGGHDESEY